MYSVGDVIDITNPKVIQRRSSETEDNFQPLVTSGYELMLNEERSELCLHDEEDVTEYKKLLFLPSQPPSNFLTLSDICSKNKDLNLAGQFVNMLVAVQRVLETRDINTRNGRSMQILEMFVMDRTYSGFYLQSWNRDNILRAQSWKSKSTVLFISDVRIEWDGYKKCVKGNLVDKTVLTENPRTKEAALLTEYLKTTPQSCLDINTTLPSYLLPNPDSITTVMSCQSVLKKSISTDEEFTAVVYATLTLFDFDSESVVSDKCGECGRRAVNVCKNEECPFMGEESRVNSSFDIFLKLTDHTGSLKCRLGSRTAEKVLSVTMEDYIMMNMSEKLSVKWKYLLKGNIAKLLIRPSNNFYRYPNISVLSLEPISMSELNIKIPVF